MRRSPAQIASDRAALAEHFARAERPTRPPTGANSSDLAALVRAGVLSREVRREWEGVYSPGFGTNGMVVTCQRRRAYYWPASTTDEGEEW
jgi:hypothetical protein